MNIFIYTLLLLIFVALFFPQPCPPAASPNCVPQVRLPRGFRGTGCVPLSLQQQHGGVNNVFGHPMYLVNDGLNFETGGNRIRDYDDLNRRLCTQIIRGNKYIDSTQGDSSPF